MLPQRRIDILGALLDEAAVYSDSTPQLNSWIEHIPAFVDRARAVFGEDLPRVDFYFFATYGKFLSAWPILTGHEKLSSWWQSGTGFYRDGHGTVLMSAKGNRGGTNGVGLVMHEYSHALSGYLTQKHRMPSWLNEGLAEYLALPWTEPVDLSECLRRCAKGGHVATYDSFVRSIYKKPTAGYAIARAMVVEMLKECPDSVIPELLKKAQLDKKSYSKVIQEVCGITPKKLFERIVFDSGVEVPTARKRVSEKKPVWLPSNLNAIESPSLSDCLGDFYYWKIETYGARFLEKNVHTYSYPHWQELSLSFLHELNGARDQFWIDVMPRVDREHKLFTYLSEAEIYKSFDATMPEDIAEYLGDCAASLDGDLKVRVEQRFFAYLAHHMPPPRKDVAKAFLIEHDRFWWYASTNSNDTGLSHYTRFARLGLALLNLIRAKPLKQWNKNLRWSIEHLTKADQNRAFATSLTERQRREMLSSELPDFLRTYLLGV